MQEEDLPSPVPGSPDLMYAQTVVNAAAGATVNITVAAPAGAPLVLGQAPTGGVRCTTHKGKSNQCKRYSFDGFKKCKECRESIRKSKKRPTCIAKMKAILARFHASEKGKKLLKIHQEVAKSDPSVNLFNRLRNSVTHVLSGRCNVCGFFTKHTGITAPQLLTHFESFFSDNNGFNWQNYGKMWQNDHGIPQNAYKPYSLVNGELVLDEEEVKRCWSLANMKPKTAKDNKEKQNKIIDAECLLTGISNFPKSWNGQIPTDSEKEKLYAEWHQESKMKWAKARAKLGSSSTDPVQEEEVLDASFADLPSSDEEEEGN